MPNLNIQRLLTLTADPTVSAVLRAQDKHNTDIQSALNAAIVRGDSLQILTPYTATAPLVMPSAWTNVSVFLNSWANTGGFTTAYRVGVDGRVYVRGNVINGTANSVVFTLPAALKPPQDANFPTEGNSLFAKVLVEASTGNVKQAAGGNNMSLDVINYEPATPATWVPSCFPFDVVWPQPYPPTLVLAQCQDVSNQTSPSHFALCLPDWVTVAAPGQTIIRVRNIPGLAPSTNFAVTLLCL